MLVHDGERGAALREPLGQLGAARVIRRQVLHDVARRRDVRLVAVLLEEQPLQRLRAAERGRPARTACLRRGTRGSRSTRRGRAVVELERRDPAVRVAPQKLRRARLAGIDIELGPA